MTKPVYNFHPATGELIGAADADESPLESGVFLIPAYATDIEPPQAGARQVAAFVGNAWTLVPDWRGVPLFSTADGSPVSITEIGQSPQDVGATEVTRPSMAHVWSDGGWHLDDALLAQLDEQATLAMAAKYEAALDAHLDAVAKAHRYNDRFTFALRAGYAGPYQAEGVAFAQWMDACNVEAFAMLQRVLAGEQELPTLGGFIAALPAFVMPEAA